VIEVLVNAGDELSAEDSIITLESDKASMEIPTIDGSRVCGAGVSVVVVFGVGVNIGAETAVVGVSTLGDKIKLGDLILNIESAASSD
jgi:pyruvate dehydrogenase E2 component (dihydrolipoamide acetyltransferase)